MKCNKDYDLVGFLNNEVTKEEKAEISRHIGECSDCLHELAGIRAALQSLKGIPAIEPSRDFTACVLKAVKSVAQVSVPVHVSAATAESPPTAGETLLDILKYYLKLSPPWAFSTALHAVILALLAFVFVSQSYQKPAPNQNIIHWTTVLLPKEEVVTEPVRTVDLPSETLPTDDINIDRAALVAKLRKGEDKMVGNLIKRADKQAREELLAKYSGQGTEEAVANGMKWLSSTQEPAGNWIPSKYNGRDEYTAALTGLATLCYTAQGNSHLSGAYSGTVDKSVRYLISVQQTDGQINTQRTSQNMYNHGIATYALLEDYLIVQEYAEKTQGPDLLSEILEDSVVKAISFIIKAQSANGGWGYESRSRTPDTSITVWQIHVLRLASVLDIEGVAEALHKSRQWLDNVTNDDGLVGYQARLDYPNGPDTLTAAGLNAWLMIQSMPGMVNSNDAIAKRMDGLKTKQLLAVSNAKSQISSNPTLTKGGKGGFIQDEETDLYYWYWSSPTMMSAVDWDKFNTALKEAILKGQSKDVRLSSVEAQGNWPGDDQWSVYGGEIYTASMAVLCLQVYYRNPELKAN